MQRGHNERHPVPGGILSTLRLSSDAQLSSWAPLPSHTVFLSLKHSTFVATSCLCTLAFASWILVQCSMFSPQQSLPWTSEFSHSLTHRVYVFFTETRTIWKWYVHLHSILVIPGTYESKISRSLNYRWPLGEIQGQVPASLWSQHFHQPINT